MIGTDTISRVIGKDVYDESGDKIGSASEVYLDDETGQPEWVTVKTGLFGTKESFVPIRDADLTDDGVRVPRQQGQGEGRARRSTPTATCPRRRSRSSTATTAWAPACSGTQTARTTDDHRARTTERPPAWPRRRGHRDAGSAGAPWATTPPARPPTTP